VSSDVCSSDLYACVVACVCAYACVWCVCVCVHVGLCGRCVCVCVCVYEIVKILLTASQKSCMTITHGSILGATALYPEVVATGSSVTPE